LVQALEDRLQQGLLHISQDDEPIAEAVRARDILAQVLEQQLPKLAKAALPCA
jgi:hypothetical protein